MPAGIIFHHRRPLNPHPLQKTKKQKSLWCARPCASVSSWHVLTHTLTTVRCEQEVGASPRTIAHHSFRSPHTPLKDGTQGHWTLQCGVGEVTGDTSNVFSARLRLVPTLSNCVSPANKRKEGGSGPERASVFHVCLPCKLFSCAVDLGGERTDGQDGCGGAGEETGGRPFV